MHDVGLHDWSLAQTRADGQRERALLTMEMMQCDVCTALDRLRQAGKEKAGRRSSPPFFQ
jgi:hypothetical protein